MPDDSGGNNSLPPGYLAVTGQTVLASQHNPPLEDLSASMTRRYMRDGRTPMLGNIPMNGYRATGAADAVGPQDYVTLSQLEEMLDAFVAVPSGLLLPYTISSATAPAGYLFANGQTVTRASYPALWAAVSGGNNLAATEGTKTAGQFGPGDGSTTFSVPNLYADGGYFIRPVSTGRNIGTLQADEIRSHIHTGITTTDGNHSHPYVDQTVQDPGLVAGGGSFLGAVALNKVTDAAGSHFHSLSINSTGGAETRPKNIAYPVIIKT